MSSKCLFIGSKMAGLKALMSIVNINSESIIGCITLDDRADCRSQYDSYIDFCKKNNLPLEVVSTNKEIKKLISKYKPDFCLVIGWYLIISDDILKMCTEGFIGVHFSMLPLYRGFSPLVWSIINGEKKGGVSLFYFNSNMDEGDIIDQEEFEISENDYVSDALGKAESVAQNLIRKNYVNIINKNVNRKVQINKNSSYCSQRLEKDGRIDWKKTNYEIYNFIRAQSKPYPGAFSFDEDGNKIKIYEASIFENEYYGMPGLIVSVESNKVLVCCGKGALYLKFDFNIKNSNFKLGYGKIIN